MRRGTSRASGIALLCGVIAALMLISPATAGSTAPRLTYERTGFKATNAQRADRDMTTFKKQKCLQKYADRQARRMAKRNKMFHQDLWKVLSVCHMSRVGENVAYGFSTGKSVVKAGWMKSPPHRANILNRRFRLMAVGASRSDQGVWYAAQVFGRR